MAEDKGKEVKKEGAGLVRLVLAAVPRGRVGLTRIFPGSGRADLYITVSWRTSLRRRFGRATRGAYPRTAPRGDRASPSVKFGCQ